MKLSEMLKTLAQGINPETGEVLSPVSIANKPEAIRLLFALSEELSEPKASTKKKNKLTDEQKREKNIIEGRPPKSHFPWSETEKRALEHQFKTNQNIEKLALDFERTPLAIALQLEKVGLIAEEDVSMIREATLPSATSETEGAQSA